MKNCFFCTNNFKYIDYKDSETLKRLLDPYGRIVKHKRSGVCAKHQRQATLAVKRARYLALLPYLIP